MSEICIDPKEVGNDNLMAYIDGTAGEAVIQHVRRCSYCAHQVEDLATLQATLTAKLFRHSCPPSDQLIAYHQSELQGNEKLVVVQHLRQCPHCARELATLARDEKISLKERVHAAMKVLEGKLVTPQVQAARALRSLPAARFMPQVYQADEIEIIVNQQPSRTYPQGQELSGLVHIGGQVPETIGEARAELYWDDGLIAITQLNPRGQFYFVDVDPAYYDIGLLWEDREIWLKGIQVK